MRNDPSNGAEREQRWSEVLVACLEEVEAGQHLDRHTLLARYPEFAAELEEFLAHREQVDRLTAPLRRFVQESRDATPPPGDNLLLEPQQQDGSVSPTATATFGDFRLFREVGRGGMGVVYEAEQISLGRRVALKVLPFAATMDPRHLQRFQNEARAAASLEHPHIVPVYGVGCERGVHFYAMKFIDGQSLAALIAEQRQASEPRTEGSGVSRSPPQPLTPLRSVRGSDTPSPQAALATQRAPRNAAAFRQIAEWGIQAAEALEHAHSLGIVHRDIKPANLMIDGQGKLWVTDFGLARMGTEVGLTMTGDVLGTLRYMSPEQAMAKHGLVDHRTDLYSLGVTLYELLTGTPAVVGSDREEILKAITFDEPRPPRALAPNIPHDMETIVLKAMASEPTERYGTAKELTDDLRRFLENRSVVASRPTYWQRSAKWARRHSSFVWATSLGLAIAVVALAAGTFLAWHAYQEEAKQRQLADDRLQDAREQRRQARRAVDKMYLEVADKWLDRQPQMGELQKQFLQEVLGYYQDFAEEKGEDEEARFDRAMAALRVGHLRIFSLNRNDQAQEPLLKANALLEELAQQFPDKPIYISKLANALNLLAFSGAGDLHQNLKRSVQLMEGLVERYPGEAEYRYELAIRLSNLAMDVTNAGNLKEGENLCRRAIALAEALIQLPSPRYEYYRVLAAGASNLAESLQQAGNWSEAAENFRKAIAALNRLTPDSSGLPEYQHHLPPFFWHNLGNDYRELSTCLGELKRVEEAESAIAQAIRIHAKLVDDFPTAQQYWTALFRDYRDKGTMYWSRGRFVEADHAYGLALEFEARTANVFHVDELVDDFARFLVTCPDPKWRRAKQAQEWATKAIQGSQKLAAGPWNVLGIAHYRLGDYGLAITALEKAMSLRPAERPDDLFFLAMAHWQLLHAQQAREWYDKGIGWMNKNQVQNQELVRYRAEAANLLNILDSSPANLEK
jgi:eukaryotic-like serine/threonine-protein kinase